MNDHGPGRDVVCSVVTDWRGTLHGAQSTLHCAEQGPDGFTVGREFNLHELVAITVDGRVVFPAFAVDILGDVKGILVTLGAEAHAGPVDLVGVGT